MQQQNLRKKTRIGFDSVVHLSPKSSTRRLVYAIFIDPGEKKEERRKIGQKPHIKPHQGIPAEIYFTA